MKKIKLKTAMKRLFMAINLPENIKNELAENINEISDLFPEGMGREVATWVRKDNLHITLLFIGDTRDEDIPAVLELVNEVAKKHSPFEIQLERICYGPDKKIPPRLIWLELAENKQLSAMTNELKERAGERGLLRKFEDRPFSPHITLARIKEWQWRKIEPEERPDIDRDISLSFKVESIDLMESVLKRGGAEYTVLKSESLNGKIVIGN
ncbi:MAG: RNA 2',3'-cyclic phosphodiesterase [Patescibacteria group bacterium]